MGGFISLNRRVKALKKKVQHMPETSLYPDMDFSKVPTEILRRIAYPGDFEESEYTQEELEEIFREYEVIKADRKAPV